MKEGPHDKLKEHALRPLRALFQQDGQSLIARAVGLPLADTPTPARDGKENTRQTVETTSAEPQTQTEYELPAVFSILIYTHPETGFPLAICDGSFHTLMRTGAAAAVSAKWLARPDSKVLTTAGTGSVGQGTLATCDAVFDWDEVRIWSRTQESLDRFLASERPKYPHLEIMGSTELEPLVRVGARRPRRVARGPSGPGPASCARSSGQHPRPLPRAAGSGPR